VCNDRLSFDNERFNNIGDGGLSETESVDTFDNGREYNNN
jgi:hypothetical protein